EVLDETDSSVRRARTEWALILDRREIWLQVRHGRRQLARRERRLCAGLRQHGLNRVLLAPHPESLVNLLSVRRVVAKVRKVANPAESLAVQHTCHAPLPLVIRGDRSIVRHLSR